MVEFADMEGYGVVLRRKNKDRAEEGGEPGDEAYMILSPISELLRVWR